MTFPRCVHDTAPQTGSYCSLLTAACKYARDQRLQEKQKTLNSLPSILRPKNKKSRELAAVAHFQQKIRPRRFVDTDKLNRKQWARTEVALNPFLYGKKDELTMVCQSPLKTLQSLRAKDSQSQTLHELPQSHIFRIECFGPNRPFAHGTKLHILVSKLHSGTSSKTKAGALLWKSYCATCSPEYEFCTM